MKFDIPENAVKSDDVAAIVPHPPAMIIAPAVVGVMAGGSITQEFAAPVDPTGVTSSGVLGSTPLHTCTTAAFPYVVLFAPLVTVSCVSGVAPWIL
jgi:hypothetical protein